MAASASVTNSSSKPSTGAAVAQSAGSASVGSQGTTTFPPTVAPALVTIYQAYIQDPTEFTVPPSADSAQLVLIQGDQVGIQVRDGNPADFGALLAELQNAGMQILASDATYGLIQGMLPIAQLPAVAALPEIPSVGAMFRPVLQ
jgi:hypothetical protein